MKFVEREKRGARNCEVEQRELYRGGDVDRDSARVFIGTDFYFIF